MLPIGNKSFQDIEIDVFFEFTKEDEMPELYGFKVKVRKNDNFVKKN